MVDLAHPSTCAMHRDHAQLGVMVAWRLASPVQELFLSAQREEHGTVIVALSVGSSFALVFFLLHALADLLDKVPIGL